MLTTAETMLILRRRRWTPAKLGAALYGLYLPTPGYVWQDAARTTPATLATHPVGALDDQSGNGRHLTQATAASRPTLALAGGVYGLTFDGTDDALTRAAVSYGASGLTF